MKQFKPTYLYVKTHNITGLKYFGKTTSNKTNYRGSGTYWKRHLKKHGCDITTEIIGYFTDADECMRVALEFSQTHNIVQSIEWANQCVENGLAGGDTISNRTQADKAIASEKRRRTIAEKSPEELAEWRAKNSAGVRDYIANNQSARQIAAQRIVETRRSSGKPWHAEETRAKITANNKVRTDAVRAKISKTLTGRKNPEHSKRMSEKVGLDNKNTRIFIVIDPNFQTSDIIGCKALRQYCRDKKVAYEQLVKHINCGKIQNVAATRPGPRVRNVIGYEIKEVKNDKFEKI